MNLIKNTLTAILISMVFYTQPTLAQDNLSEKQIEAIVRKLIDREPGIVIGAIQKFQHEQQRAQIAPIVESYNYLLAGDKNAAFMGNPNGDVTIVEFFDYRCGYCRRHYPEIKSMVERDGNIKWVFKQYPVLDRNGEAPISRIAARAALAAHAQGKFAAYHDALMTASGKVTEDLVYSTLKDVGVDVSIAKIFMLDKTTDRTVETGLLLGAQMKISGTPFYLVGTDFMEGAQGDDALLRIIRNARAARK